MRKPITTPDPPSDSTKQSPHTSVDSFQMQGNGLHGTLCQLSLDWYRLRPSEERPSPLFSTRQFVLITAGSSRAGYSFSNFADGVEWMCLGGLVI
jgi:hypothetical protein